MCRTQWPLWDPEAARAPVPARGVALGTEAPAAEVARPSGTCSHFLFPLHNRKPHGTVPNYQSPDASRENRRRAHTVTRQEGRAVSRRRRRRRRGWGGVGGSRKCISLGPSGRCGIGAWERLARAAEKPVTGRSGAIPALRSTDR